MTAKAVEIIAIVRGWVQKWHERRMKNLLATAQPGYWSAAVPMAQCCADGVRRPDRAKRMDPGHASGVQLCARPTSKLLGPGAAGPGSARLCEMEGTR